ncbi:MAG: baseplate J/gp47 family protein [Oscillospiraceae bacterium]|nr:baseplate J/gp47 family protein [Candidatus Ruminococcus equi]
MSSFDEILHNMVEEYESKAQCKINDESDIMLRLKVLAGELYKQNVQADFVLRQMFVNTATGEYLDMHAQRRGLNRKDATKAKGVVTFYADTIPTENITVSAGTVICTSSDEAIRFVTDEDVTMYHNVRTVTAPVTAEVAGKSGNVEAGAVSVIVTPVVGITSVKNLNAFEGGENAENDENLRKRVLESYKDISNGTNSVYYKKLAQSIDGVYSAGVYPKARGTGTVNVYVAAKGGPVTASVLSQVQDIMDVSRELNVDVKVYQATRLNYTLYVRLEQEDGYDFDELSITIRNKLCEYINSLGIGVDVLLKDIGEIIYHTDGVKNFTFLSASMDVHPYQYQYVYPYDIIFRQVGE